MRTRKSASSTDPTTLTKQATTKKPTKTATTRGKSRKGRKDPQLEATGEAAGPSDEPQNETTRAMQAAFERVKRDEEELMRELEGDAAFQAVRALSWQK